MVDQSKLSSLRDRKRKKFVGESEKEGRKKVKTESGTWIAASYKSNAYPVTELNGRTAQTI